MINSTNKDEELEKALTGFDVLKEEKEVIALKNPVLNAIFHGNNDTGGISRGTVIQIASQSGVGKSTLALVTAKELCEQGLSVLYIDAEKGLNQNMMTSIGIIRYLRNKNNPKGNFIVVRTCDCNEVNVLIQKVCETKAIDFIVLDSLGSLDSGIYSVGGTDANNPKVGADSKSLKIVMKTINRMALENNTGFILINHLAQSIGTYIPQENPVGGRASIFLSDIIIKLTRKSSDFEKLNLGQKVEYETTKSRFGIGKCKIPFYIAFGKGIALIPTFSEVLDKIKENGKPILEMRGAGNGSLFLEGKEYKFRGENQLIKLICDNYKKIYSLVDWRIFLPEEPKEASSIYLKDLELDDVKEVLPKELSKLEIVDVIGNDYYFDRGIDSTGQKYYICYNKDSEQMKVGYDSSSFETSNISLKDYKTYKKDLTQYLKSL